MTNASNYVRAFISLACSLFAAIIILHLIIYLNHWIHEAGHIVTGTVFWRLAGHSNTPYISAWRYDLILPAPQQSANLPSNPIVGLAGMFSELLVILSIAYILSKFFKVKRTILAVFIFVFLFYQISANFICGTDNYKNNPLEFCQPLLATLATYAYLSISTILFVYIISPKIDGCLIKCLK